jgi:hypothetical protein
MRFAALALILATAACGRFAMRRSPAPPHTDPDVPDVPDIPAAPIAELPSQQQAPETVAAPPAQPEPPARIEDGTAAERIRGVALDDLAAPHRERHRDDDDDAPRPHKPDPSEEPVVHAPADLRGLVGHHDRRDAVLVALGWARQLGARVGGPSGGELVAWARRQQLLAPPTEAAAPGDLLVFDRTEGDGRAELVGVVVARDLHGVTEFVYLGGEIVRRGFVDTERPSLARDPSGAVVNTYLCHVKRAMPPKGTRYLAGELLAHVVHVTTLHAVSR